MRWCSPPGISIRACRGMVEDYLIPCFLLTYQFMDVPKFRIQVDEIGQEPRRSALRIPTHSGH
jgi:hypothetical protein